jgi:peptide/nickel transport system ATP-binding protein
MSATSQHVESGTSRGAARTALLRAQDLAVQLRDPSGTIVAPVREASFDIHASEILGVVGESGSGKTTLARALTGLFPTGDAADVRGSVSFLGRDLLALSEEELRRIRGKEISYVFQSAETALNPTRTVGHQMSAVMRAHRPISKAACRSDAIQFLDLVDIPEPADVLRRFPHQLSGGMKQRVMIGMALANDPALLIADEPTSALDVLVRERVVELFQRLRRELGIAILVISHDLHLVSKMADRVMVFYGGRIVEIGDGSSVLTAPLHRYTSALLRAVPSVETEYGAVGSRLETIPGTPVGARESVDGCAFAPRCAAAQAVCHEQRPRLEEKRQPRLARQEDAHVVACWFPNQTSAEKEEQ